MSASQVLVVDDEPAIRLVLSEVLRREGLTSTECTNGADAVELVKKNDYAIVIMDIRMPRMDGLTALREIRLAKPDTLVVLVTAHGNEKTAVEAVQAGAYDYFTKPFDLNEVRVVVRRAIERVKMQAALREAREQSVSRYSFDRIVGQSQAMRGVFDILRRVLDNDVSVLVTGESGTGKELIAAAVHYNSPRRDGPFIKVNTVAIPEALLESEMFGHERGSFTGAVSQKIGKVEAANGGTLFLDEIGDMPLPLQAKLLRTLQEREITRVGSNKSVKVDIRVVCATHRDLAKAVKEGTFREDLYYRINVMPIYLPPLRERQEDIPLLLDHFIRYYNPRLGKAIRGVEPAALEQFLRYPWPGNVRELENVVQRTLLMAQTDTIMLDDLPPVMRDTGRRSSALVPLPALSDTAGAAPSLAEDANNPLASLDLKRLLDTEDFSVPLADRLAQISDHIEKYLIQAALAKCHGHRQETADKLGMSRKSLHNKMVRFGLFEDDKRSLDDAL